jgi:hypothetical protein
MLPLPPPVPHHRPLRANRATIYRRAEVISSLSGAIRRSAAKLHKAGTLMMFHLQHIEPWRAIKCRFSTFTSWLTGPELCVEEECVRIRSGQLMTALKLKTQKPIALFRALRRSIFLIHSLIDEQSRKMLRVLLCFDFAYGFPRDFSAALQTATGKTDAALDVAISE